MLTTRPPARPSAGSAAWNRASGATVLTARTRAKTSGGRSASGGSGLGPRSLALLTRRSRRSGSAAASAPRWSGSATSPGIAGTSSGGGGGAAAGLGVGGRGDWGAEPVGVPAVEDEPPAAVVEGGGQRAAEAAGGAGDHCGGGHGTTLGPQVDLRSRGA